MSADVEENRSSLVGLRIERSVALSCPEGPLGGLGGGRNGQQWIAQNEGAAA
jgi:hypothetical protein